MHWQYIYVRTDKRVLLPSDDFISSSPAPFVISGYFFLVGMGTFSCCFHAESLCGSTSLLVFLFFFFSRHVFQHVSKGLESAHCVVTCAYLTLLCSLTSFCLQSLGSYLTIRKEFWVSVIADPAYCPLPSAKKKAWRSRGEESHFGIFNCLSHVGVSSLHREWLQLWLLPEKKLHYTIQTPFFIKWIKGNARALW